MLLVSLPALLCEICFEGVNNSRSSIIASQFQIGGEMFSPIGILWYKYEALPKYGKIPYYLFEFFDNLKE